MLSSSELFLFLAQIGKYHFGHDDGTGRPDFWVPEFEMAYNNFVISLVKPPQALSDEIFMVLKKMITVDAFHKYVSAYLKVEEGLRQQGQSELTYDIFAIKRELARAAPFFEAQYTKEKKAFIKPEDVPEDLLTVTGGRLVRLKDYLFQPGPRSQLASAELKDHEGHIIDWP